MKYSVCVEKNDEGYSVWCPGLHGCFSQGDTEEEAIENIKDAIKMYLEAQEEVLNQQNARIIEVAV